MTLLRKRLYTLLSISIILIWIVAIWVICSDVDGIFDSLAFAYLFTYTILFSVGVGTGLLLMRLFGVNKTQIAMIYILFGILNLCCGATYCFINDFTSTLGLSLFTASIFIGMFICWDVYVRKWFELSA